MSEDAFFKVHIRLFELCFYNTLYITYAWGYNDKQCGLLTSMQLQLCSNGVHSSTYKSITICIRHHTLLMYMPWWCALIHACLPHVATSHKAYHRSGGWYACQHLSLNTFKLLSRTTASTVCSLCMRRNCRETGNKTTHQVPQFNSISTHSQRTSEKQGRSN